jgi:hypothetical protein
MRIEFGRISGDWSDRPVIIVACGPSMAGFDLNRLRGLGHVLAIKEMVFDIPWADEGFSLDLGWISKARRQRDIEQSKMRIILALPTDENLHIDAPAPRPGLTFVERRRGDFLSSDPGIVHSGGNSGFGALTLPYQRHARDVFMFGYDYRTGNGRHHYDNSRYPLAQEHGHWRGWAKKFDLIRDQVAKAGMTITIAGPSEITAFPKVSHDVAIEMLHRLRSSRG